MPVGARPHLNSMPRRRAPCVPGWRAPGQTWYHLPRQEYHALVDAAQQDERDDRDTQAAAQALIVRERAEDERRKFTEQHQEREAKRQEPAWRSAEEQQ